LNPPLETPTFGGEREREADMMRSATAMMCLILMGGAAGAQSTRYTFQTVEGGVMRLDAETGHVSFCTRTGEGYACRSAPDDRAALQEEIDRLKRENERLKLGAAPQPAPGGRLQLPSEEEIDKAMGLFERMMRRMMRTFREEGAEAQKL
jgi:predicted transglutaminase-like cysteine proteinase